MQIYTYDGSFEGLLTTLFYTYNKQIELSIIKEKLYLPNLLDEVFFIPTECNKAERVYRSLEDKLSSTTLSYVYFLYLSEIPQVENLILDYIRLCYRYSDTINLAKNNNIIHQVDLYVKRVTKEVHRMIGFVRFKEIAPLLFYAPIETDHNILPLLKEHFERRFSDQTFIIHDCKRHQALFYNQKYSVLHLLSPEESHQLETCNIQDPFEVLFKKYYDSATIQERLNPKRRNAFMPSRYFKHLVEL